MDIFRRKKKVPVAPEPEGTANLAKQVNTGTVTATRPAARPSPAGAPTQSVEADRTAARFQTGGEHDVIYSFTTSMTPYGKRSTRWFVFWATAFAIIVAINIWLKLYFSAAVIGLAATILFVQASQKPKTVRIQFTRAGLKIGQQLTTWRDLEKFWILFEPPQLNRLHLKRKSRLVSELTIDLGSQDPLKIRDLLLAWVPEDPTREESRIDQASRMLKL